MDSTPEIVCFCVDLPTYYNVGIFSIPGLDRDGCEPATLS